LAEEALAEAAPQAEKWQAGEQAAAKELEVEKPALP
jgi:hypothetical protein